MTIRQDYIDRLIALANEFGPHFGVGAIDPGMFAEAPAAQNPVRQRAEDLAGAASQRFGEILPELPQGHPGLTERMGAPDWLKAQQERVTDGPLQPKPARTMDDVEREILTDQALGRIRDDRLPAHGEMRAYQPSLGERASGAVQDVIGGDMGRKVAGPVGPVVDTAYALSGIPMGVSAGQQLAASDSAAEKAATLARLGVGVVPGTRVGRQVMSTLPGMAGVAATAAGLGMLAPTPAEAQQARRAPAGPATPAASGPIVPGLTQEQSDELRRAKIDIMRQNYETPAQRRLLEQTIQRLEGVSAAHQTRENENRTVAQRAADEREARLKTEADAAAARIKAANTPFRDAYPMGTAALAGTGMLAAGALGYRGQSIANAARNAEIAAAQGVRDRAIRGAQTNWNADRVQPSLRDINLAQKAQGELNAFGSDTPKPFGKPYVGATVAGELGVSMPELLDYILAPGSGPLRDATVAKFADPTFLASRIALGATAGLIPAKIGSAFANARNPVTGVPSRSAEINAFTEQPTFAARKALWDARDQIGSEKAMTIARAENRAQLREINARGQGGAGAPDQAVGLTPGTARLPPPSGSGPQAGSGSGGPQTPPPGSPSGGRSGQEAGGRQEPDAASSGRSKQASQGTVENHWDAQPRTETGQFKGPPDPKKWKRQDE